MFLVLIGKSGDGRTMLLFLWIPVTQVITADDCDDLGDENDGVAERPCSCWRLTAHRAVILELARESRGTKATT